MAIETKAQLTLLIALQQLDLRLHQIKADLGSIPAQLEQSRQSLSQTESALQQTNRRIEDLTQQRRARERDLEVQEDRVNKLKARTTEIKTNKEYHAHLAEIETAKTEIRKIEDDLLVLMEQMETARSEAVQSESLYKTAQARFSQTQTQLETHTKTLEEELASHQAERSHLTQQMDAQLLRDYEHLKSAKKDAVVVPVRNGCCGGCSLQIQPQLVAEVKRQEKILTCSYCQRMLYWPG
jgi:predicted  nucleic acid-binding Zn-ribbon protein